ncbi:hypothetical protein PspLS_02664 [Pyricularia sp. CBS 133598]|nr:hypothetical protein PspLS_02664 [Pyricularia sp. CBS 133598]
MAPVQDRKPLPLEEVLLALLAARCDGAGTTSQGDARTTRRKREVSGKDEVTSCTCELGQPAEQLDEPELGDSIEVTPKTCTRGYGDPVQIRGGLGSPTPMRAPSTQEDAQLQDIGLQRPTPHIFFPFWPGTDFPYETTNRDIRAVVSKPLSPDELRASAAGGGYVYVFSLPSHEAVSPPIGHVKIGMTTRSVPDRMRRIASTCKYEPLVVYSVFTRYPLRVERLCHAQLRGQRRRESPGCPGCGRAHREWVEASPPEAERVVCFWSKWIEHTEPYNEDTGELKSEWSERLGEVQVDDEPGRCWGIFCDDAGVMMRARGKV